MMTLPLFLLQAYECASPADVITVVIRLGRGRCGGTARFTRRVRHRRPVRPNTTYCILYHNLDYFIAKCGTISECGMDSLCGCPRYIGHPA